MRILELDNGVLCASIKTFKDYKDHFYNLYIYNLKASKIVIRYETRVINKYYDEKEFDKLFSRLDSNMQLKKLCSGMWNFYDMCQMYRGLGFSSFDITII